MTSKECQVKIIKDYLEDDLKELMQYKKEKDIQCQALFYGKLVGKIELLPFVLVRTKEYQDIPEFAGALLFEIYRFVNYVHCNSLDKPDNYDYIMEALNENESE